MFPLFILSLKLWHLSSFYILWPPNIFTPLFASCMYIAIFSLLKISSVVKITCFFASMYCICNPLPHLTGFSSFLILVFFSTSERAHIFSYHLKDLLSFKNPFASSFFPSHTLFSGFLLSHTEWKLWKMRIFLRAVQEKWDLYFSFSFVAFIFCISGIKGRSCSLMKV